MSNLNWKNANDYTYTAKLTDAGWAWEFIRRSETYRAVYQALKSEDFERVPQGSPPHFLTSAEKAEAMSAKFPSPLRTPAQKKAALWGLFDMYDPNILYAPEKIHFETASGGHPVIYGPTGGNVRAIEEIYNVDDLPVGPTTLAVFIDFSRDITGQVNRIKDVLKECSKTGVGVVKGRRRDKEWPRYLRMLDALDDMTVSRAQKIKIIDAEKNWKHKEAKQGEVYGVKDVDVSDLAKYADDTLAAAVKMTESGFRFLLRAI